MYTKNIDKQNIVIAGVSGSLICELDSGDFKSLKAFRKELKDIDCFEAFIPEGHAKLCECKSLDEVRTLLVGINNLFEYKLVKRDLDKVGISCCGYVEQGRNIQVYNSKAQLTIDCRKPTGPQIESFINKWA